MVHFELMIVGNSSVPGLHLSSYFNTHSIYQTCQSENTDLGSQKFDTTVYTKEGKTDPISAVLLDRVW